MTPSDARQQDGTTASLFARSAGSQDGTTASLFARSAGSAVHGTLVGGWHPLTSPSVWSRPLPVTGAASEAVVSSSPLAAPPAVTPVAPPQATQAEDIRVGKDGRIHGVDGMLDQIAQALARHAGPMLVRDVLPVVQRDEALHERVGAAAGVAMADKLRPWVIAGAAALGVLAAIEGYRLYTQRTTMR